MLRLPLNIWGMLTSSMISIVVFPVLLGAGVLLLADRTLGTSFFVPAGLVIGEKLVAHSGGHPLLWQHLFWFFGHPEVYIVIVPAMGIAAEILATFIRKPVFGYKAKQVRDNLHSLDVCRAIVAFAERPSAAAVYNLGGGRENSISMLEAIARFEDLYGRKLAWEYVEEPRVGDHVCYISDLARLRADFPEWDVSVTLDEVVESFADARRVGTS